MIYHQNPTFSHFGLLDIAPKESVSARYIAIQCASG